MKTPDLYGWEKLICPYFTSTCRRVLGQYLEGNGFTETGLNVIGGVTFSRLGVFLDVDYDLEPAPQELTMLLGITNKKYGPKAQSCRVPYWWLLRRNSPENTVSNTRRRNEAELEFVRFRNEAELEAVLLRFRDVFLETCAKPLWLDPGRLEQVIDEFTAGITGSSKASS